MANDPIEKKPLFHFHPGTKCLSFGSWGCNFHCSGCQNWQIACPTNGDIDQFSKHVTPSQAVEMALSQGSKGIAWTYNEPGIWLEYTIDTAKLAREKGLYTVFVTNGYSTSEALDSIGPYLDAWRVDVKGFSDDAYKRLAKVTNWRGILEVAEMAKKKWKMHIEVVTNVTPGINDDDIQLAAIAGWIRDKLGELTPWHVTRFFPHRFMDDISPTPVERLERAAEIGMKNGLRFVFLGNVTDPNREDTRCFSCDALIIRRNGYQVNIQGLDGTRCKHCGQQLDMVTGTREELNND
jgi:pyruvate formate lyase activating enzyme